MLVIAGERGRCVVRRVGRVRRRRPIRAPKPRPDHWHWQPCLQNIVWVAFALVVGASEGTWDPGRVFIDYCQYCSLRVRRRHSETSNGDADIDVPGQSERRRQSAGYLMLVRSGASQHHGHFYTDLESSRIVPPSSCHYHLFLSAQANENTHWQAVQYRGLGSLASFVCMCIY